MTDAYAALRDAAKERQKESPGRPKKGVELIPQVYGAAEDRPTEAPAPKTRDIRAKAAGLFPPVFSLFPRCSPARKKKSPEGRTSGLSPCDVW